MSIRSFLRRAIHAAWPLLLACSGWTAAVAAPPAASAPAPDGAAAFRSECGECHVAFPPQLLAAASWRALMQGLDKHFGVDASIDAATARAIGSYLERAAGYSRYGEPAASAPQLRITTSRWFVREHERFSPADLKRHSAASLADCGACHSGAAQGQFEEDDEHGRHGEHGGHDHD